MSRHAYFVFLLVALIASGCAGISPTGASVLPAGDAQRGRELFSRLLSAIRRLRHVPLAGQV